MHPQLARTYRPGQRISGTYFLQPKLNGIRALYQGGVFQSRDEKLWKVPVLRHIWDGLVKMRSSIGNLILDGELYVHGWKLQRINSAVAVNRDLPTDDTPFVQYHIFDCIVPDDLGLCFSSRIERLCRAFPAGNPPNVQGVQTIGPVMLHEEIDYHFNIWTSQGFEGLMIRPDGPYIEGKHVSPVTMNLTERRSENLWKYKSWQDAEFTCVGTTPGEGKAASGIGALICSTPTGATFNVGTGYSDEERREYLINPPIAHPIKVKFIGYSDAGIPLNPSFLAVL